MCCISTKIEQLMKGALLLNILEFQRHESDPGFRLICIKRHQEFDKN